MYKLSDGGQVNGRACTHSHLHSGAARSLYLRQDAYSSREVIILEATVNHTSDQKKKLVFNPYLPAWEYVPDGEPHVFGGRLYIYGSHDRFGSEDYCPNDYVCWSAPVTDLAAWRYEGVIYTKDQDPRSRGKLNLYAPDAAPGPDGRYYLFYSAANTSVISVAVCDTPAGRYEYYGDVHRPDGHVWGTAAEDWFEFDPAVLVDDDGRIWLYSGSSQDYNKRFGHPVVGAFVHELAPDMLTTIGEPKIVMPVRRGNLLRPNFFEGSSIRKYNGRYYFIYAATNVTGLNYCVSDRPDGDFVYQGCLHNSSDIGINGHTLFNSAYPIGNYHGSLVKIGEDYYIFDHRQTNRNFYTRQGVAERIRMDADGYFAQAECTSCGLYGDSLPGRGIYPAYIACSLMGRFRPDFWNLGHGPYITQQGPDREGCPDSYVTAITDRCRVGYKYFDLDGTARKIQIQIRGEAKGVLRVLDGERGACLAEFRLDMNRKDWKVCARPMKPRTGKTAIFFSYRGEGSLDLRAFALR